MMPFLVIKSDLQKTFGKLHLIVFVEAYFFKYFFSTLYLLHFVQLLKRKLIKKAAITTVDVNLIVFKFISTYIQVLNLSFKRQYLKYTGM
jgi:hypothetical protein